MVAFRKSLELLTLLGGTVLIVLIPVVTISLVINKVDQQHYDSLDIFYGYLERSEETSQQRLNLARLAKMDDKELETFAAAAAKEMKKRRKHANHEDLPES
ncbi:hypothetical protein EDD37DRAFT_608765 [Exophiala viscosa]|uniref:uncharacterized protein n=1 Tax=Exophiala viscosa TaxID=2486360 RepID=UPI002194C9E0|nr:hypothetical protein EDD37DRAFT_608765 [Exophiala viscosa]